MFQSVGRISGALTAASQLNSFTAVAFGAEHTLGRGCPIWPTRLTEFYGVECINQTGKFKTWPYAMTRSSSPPGASGDDAVWTGSDTTGGPRGCSSALRAEAATVTGRAPGSCLFGR